MMYFFNCKRNGFGLKFGSLFLAGSLIFQIVAAPFAESRMQGIERIQEETSPLPAPNLYRPIQSEYQVHVRKVLTE
ncbi:MAG: hypothetical protein HYY63_06465, partial [Elusimicrobia bacterium]|nr:hypothetical protein [Elusimicrobiota bacterium]